MATKLLQKLSQINIVNYTNDWKYEPIDEYGLEEERLKYTKEYLLDRERQQTNPDVTANLTSPTSYVFANDDGSFRTYSGTRKIFDRLKKK